MNTDGCEELLFEDLFPAMEEAVGLYRTPSGRLVVHFEDLNGGIELDIMSFKLAVKLIEPFLPKEG